MKSTYKNNELLEYFLNEKNGFYKIRDDILNSYSRKQKSVQVEDQKNIWLKFKFYTEESDNILQHSDTIKSGIDGLGGLSKQEIMKIQQNKMSGN